MPFAIEVTTTEAEMESRILKGVRDVLDLALRHAAPAIRSEIAVLVDGLIRRTPEYESLIGGDLMGELGLADPQRRVDAVLSKVREGVQVWSDTLRVVGRRIEGGLHIGMLRSSYEDVLNLAEASYVSQSSGSEIPWLGWLVGGGDRVLVYDYDVEAVLTPQQRARSRSKRALMFKGSGWKVPAAYSGTWDDNFLTRAFDVAGIESRIERIVERQVSLRVR